MTIQDLLSKSATLLYAIGVESDAKDATIATLTQQLAEATAANLPLITAADLTHVGAFKLPRGDVGGPPFTGFSYGGAALTWNPTRGSVLVVGHDQLQLVGEVGVPTLNPAATTLAQLPIAPLIQRLTDAMDGKKAQVSPSTGPVKIGGLLVDGDRVIVAAYVAYDAENEQTSSHFVRPLDLTIQGQAQGPLTISQQWKAGFVSGYMGRIPAAWQAQLKGTIFVGQGCLNIISRTSYGPGVFSLDLATILQPKPNAIPLVCYPAAHPTLGAYSATNATFNGTTMLGGVVMPEGSSSVLVFGRHGMGPNEYGDGTSTAALDGTPAGDGSTFCYDPTNSSKGSHGYPYATRVWAYDARVLAAVAAGLKQPWEPLPYAIWTIALPFDPGTGIIGGVGYDPLTGRIFLSQPGADGDAPVIHVLQVGKLGGVRTTI